MSRVVEVSCTRSTGETLRDRVRLRGMSVLAYSVQASSPFAELTEGEELTNLVVVGDRPIDRWNHARVKVTCNKDMMNGERDIDLKDLNAT